MLNIPADVFSVDAELAHEHRRVNASMLWVRENNNN